MNEQLFRQLNSIESAQRRESDYWNALVNAATYTETGLDYDPVDITLAFLCNY